MWRANSSVSITMRRPLYRRFLVRKQLIEQYECPGRFGWLVSELSVRTWVALGRVCTFEQQQPSVGDAGVNARPM